MFLDDNPKICDTAIKNTLLIKKSYTFYQNILLDKIMTVFKWENLPETLPERALEMYHHIYGQGVIANDPQAGIICTYGQGRVGITPYFDEWKIATYAAPTAKGGEIEINKTGVYWRNTLLGNSSLPLVQRYALLLAHADVSLKCALVNMRSQNVFTTPDRATVESIKQWYNTLYDGNSGAIIDKGVLESMQSLPVSTTSAEHLAKSCVEVRGEIMRQFFAEIGIRYAKEKRGNMTDDEINSDEQLLTFNVGNMLQEREKTRDAMNNIWGLNVNVQLNPIYDFVSMSKQGEEV